MNIYLLPDIKISLFRMEVVMKKIFLSIMINVVILLPFLFIFISGNHFFVYNYFGNYTILLTAFSYIVFIIFSVYYYYGYSVIEFNSCRIFWDNSYFFLLLLCSFLFTNNMIKLRNIDEFITFFLLICSYSLIFSFSSSICIAHMILINPNKKYIKFFNKVLWFL